VIAHRRYFLVLAAIFGVFWLLLAIDPHDRADWALENGLVVIAAVVLVFSYKHMLLSRISYTLIFVFLCLHAFGAHWTYSIVPYDETFRSLTGRSFNAMVGWERNNYDRIVHLTYGLLLAYPVRELFLRVAQVKGFWGYFLPVVLTVSTSTFYELVEWGAAETFGGELGIAYVGAQGDVWDSQKDTALATLGAVVAMGVTALLNLYLQKDFAREWIDSLRVKDDTPLGEDEIARLWRDRQGD
jgi:putative membrane protein